MSMVRKFICDVCGEVFTEEKFGAGAPGWGQLMGIILDGNDNPTLCSNHLATIADQLDKMKGG